MKDIFELAVEEKQKKELNRLAMLQIFHSDKRRSFVASRLYSANYPENSLRKFTTGEDTPPDEVLENF